MSITNTKLFEPQQLGTSLATLFTVGATPVTNLLKGGRIRLTNTTAGSVSVQVCAVPLAGSAGASNSVVPDNKTVPGYDYIDVDLPTMKAGDFLQAKAGAATSITAHFMAGSVFS